MPEGLDHVVTHGDDGTVLRTTAPGSDGLDVASEAALLRVVRSSVSLPVPRVLRTWPARGAMAMERVPGSPLLERLDRLGPHQADRLAGRLGGLVAELAAVPTAEVAHLVPEDLPALDDLLAEARETGARPELLDLVPASSRAALEDFMAGDPGIDEARVPVLVHGDLGAEHVFVDDEGTVTGVIDWSDAALGDPALDLGLVLRDLGPDAGEVAVTRYVAHAPDGAEVTGVLPRALFHARVRALEDLAYGVDESLALYRDNALRAIRRLF